MTPEAIKEAVYAIGQQMRYRGTDIDFVYRYMLRKHCPMLTLKQIGELTGINYSSVLYSIKVVDDRKSYFKPFIDALNNQNMTPSAEPKTLSGTLEFKRALTKEELYDKIGECNVRIVELEHDIPELHVRVHQLADAGIENPATATLLREKQRELTELKDTVAKHRKTLIARMEIEREDVQRRIDQALLLNIDQMEAHKDLLTKEIETLSKLV